MPTLVALALRISRICDANTSAARGSGTSTATAAPPSFLFDTNPTHNHPNSSQRRHRSGRIARHALCRHYCLKRDLDTSYSRFPLQIHAMPEALGSSMPVRISKGRHGHIHLARCRVRLGRSHTAPPLQSIEIAKFISMCVIDHPNVEKTWWFRRQLPHPFLS